jgi:hypothetical protein
MSQKLPYNSARLFLNKHMKVQALDDNSVTIEIILCYGLLSSDTL